MNNYTSHYQLNFFTKKLYLIINQNNYLIALGSQTLKYFNNIVKATTF